MKRLRVPEVLGAVASKCNVLAGEVSAGVPPTVSSQSRPSSAAVSLGHTGVKAAGEAMTTRMETTGTKIDGARVAYLLNEAQSTQLLHAVAEPGT